MGLTKKLFSSLIVGLLLLLPITVQGKENSERSNTIVSSLINAKVLMKEQSLNPGDYPLKNNGQAAGTLKDSKGSHYIQFQKVASIDANKMDVQLLYQSDELFDKDSYVTIEFYNNINNTLQFLGFTQFDTYGTDNGLMSNVIDKSLYKNQPYIYIRLGITPNPDDEFYTDFIMFKVANPFNTTPPPTSTQKYAIISNESVTPSKTEYTGSFSINNEKYSIEKNLNPGAYQLDYLKPFDIEKNQNKQLSKQINKQSLANKIGDNKNFWVTNLVTNAPYQINAKLTYSGTKANVWVYNNFITPQDAIKLGTEFDKKIYSSVTQNFSKESDVNKDGKINILCFDIQDGFNGSGGYVGGYFWGGDLFNVANSNQSEIFYMDTYPAMGTGTTKIVASVYSVLAHEFQHMVNFNQTAFIEKSKTNMDPWLNEGLSMAAEQIYTGKVLTNRIDYYNATGSTANGQSLLYWDDAGDTLANYSLSYLFSQYVKVQVNKGNGVFKEILLNKNNDYRAVESVLKKYINPSLNFGKFMTNFRGALLLKQSTGAYGFKGVPEFNKLQPKLYTGAPGNLSGGGAIVKPINPGFAIPANKGPHITYRIVDEKTVLDQTSPTKPTVNSVSDKDKIITGKAEVGSTVTVKLGSKVLGYGTTAANGRFTVRLKATQKAKSILAVTATDKAKNVSPASLVVVKDKTAPSTPKVNSVTKRSTYVTGKAEPSSKVYVKAGSKIIGSATTDKKGNFKVKIKPQSAGKIIYVYAKDAAGNTSKSAKLTVKK